MADSTLKELIGAIPRGGEGMAASVAAIAVRCTSTWEVIAGRVVILPAELAGELSQRIFVDLPGLVAWSAVIPADGLLAWLQKLESGSMEGSPKNDAPFRLSGRGETGWQWWPRSRIEPGESEVGFPEIRVRGAGNNIGDVTSGEYLRECELQLPACAPPFASWDHLCSIMGIEFDPNASTSRGVDVHVLTYLRFVEVEQDIRASRLVARIEGAPDTVSGAAVAFMPLVRDLHSRALTVPSQQWVSADKEWHAEISTDGIVGPIELALIANGQRVDRRLSGFPNPRVVAHDWIDSGAKELMTALLPKNVASGDQRAFEEAVATLLYLCGFASVRYGHAKLQRAPDVLAADEKLGWLVIECSVELPGVEKLKKLKARARDVWHSLRVNGPDVACLPLMFVPVSRDRVGDLEAELFGSERVGLVCAEDVRDLLDAARRGEPVRVCWEMLWRCQTRYSAVGALFPN